jgi:hypothetical protein
MRCGALGDGLFAYMRADQGALELRWPGAGPDVFSTASVTLSPPRFGCAAGTRHQLLRRPGGWLWVTSSEFSPGATTGCRPTIIQVQDQAP